MSRAAAAVQPPGRRSVAAGFGLPQRVVQLLREAGWIVQVALGLFLLGWRAVAALIGRRTA